MGRPRHPMPQFARQRRGLHRGTQGELLPKRPRRAQEGARRHKFEEGPKASPAPNRRPRRERPGSRESIPLLALGEKQAGGPDEYSGFPLSRETVADGFAALQRPSVLLERAKGGEDTNLGNATAPQHNVKAITNSQRRRCVGHLELTSQDRACLQTCLPGTHSPRPAITRVTGRNQEEGVTRQGIAKAGPETRHAAQEVKTKKAKSQGLKKGN